MRNKKNNTLENVGSGNFADLSLYYDKAEFKDAFDIVAESIASQYSGVYYIWLSNHSYICYQERLDGILSEIGACGKYESAMEIYINENVYESDKAELRDFMDISTLTERIGDKNSIVCDYRNSDGAWVRGRYLIGKRDESGNPLTLIFTVSDINEEMEEKRKREEAETAALQDSLTYLWNRKAFERFSKSDMFKNKKTGLLLFDIDRFKGINDQYGHSVGDRVITAVANEIKGNMRRDDMIFRMGGDEFAILLYDCGPIIWDAICRKVEVIHSDLKDLFQKEMNVTISAGLCLNDAGYCDQMYQLADRALYHTKANGRGGCSFIDFDGNIIGEWHDRSNFLRRGDVLEKNSTIMWRLDKPKRENLPYRAYGDELLHEFVGADITASPEGLYQKWEEGVDADNFDLLKEAGKLALSDGRVEAVFEWKHPQKGKIQIRGSASFETESEDYYTFIGYIHVLTGTHVVTMEDIGSKAKDALEELYYCNYYVRLSDYSFKVYKMQPYLMEILSNCTNALDAANTYAQTLVEDDFRDAMTVFMDLSTLKQRLKTKSYVGIDYRDPYIGLSRAKFVVVERDEEGDAETVLFVVESIQ